MSTYKILGICGSLRAKSYNRMALHAAAKLMPEGMVMEVLDYSDLPLFNEDIEPGMQATVERLRLQVVAADALLIASPEYNYSVTAPLKNLIDWLSRPKPHPLREKPVALLSATQGPVGGARNQYELRKILGGLEALVLSKPEVFMGTCQNRFDAGGELTDPASRKILGDQMIALQAWIGRMAPSPAR